MGAERASTDKEFSVGLLAVSDGLVADSGGFAADSCTSWLVSQGNSFPAITEKVSSFSSTSS